jgi:hypothetical protein
MDDKKYIGMDVHQASISIAVRESKVCDSSQFILRLLATQACLSSSSSSHRIAERFSLPRLCFHFRSSFLAVRRALRCVQRSARRLTSP